MGIILSRYRKKKNAEEQLEDIEKEIENIENNRQYTVQREKYIVWKLLLYSFLIYIISAVLFYVYFFPASLRDQIFYMIPLLIFPIIIVFVKKSITWIYSRKILKNKDKLENLRTKKKQILDDVMNTETYKVAKKILDKYAPEQIKKPPILNPTNVLRTPIPSQVLGVGNMPMGRPGVVQTLMATSTPAGPKIIPVIPRPNMSPPRRLIKPIFPRERGYLDRFIDAVIGDGPSNRYALICKNCATHNGMALKEEFEYLAYRCVYCGFPNPSLKARSRSQLSIGYSPTPAIQDGNIEDTQSDLNKTSDSDESAEVSQQSGVEITEVADVSTDKHEELTHRKINTTEDNVNVSTDDNNPPIITEEDTLQTDGNEDYEKKTQ